MRRISRGGWRRKDYSATHWEFRDKILKAFKAVRKYGILSRANFRCCQSCASYELWTIANKKEDTILGCVFWHYQDEETFRDDKPGEASLYIAFGVTSGGQMKGWTDEAIGRLLVMALKDAGLHPVWNGDSHTRILVSEKVEANQPIDVEACLSEVCTD